MSVFYAVWQGTQVRCTDNSTIRTEDSTIHLSLTAGARPLSDMAPLQDICVSAYSHNPLVYLNHADSVSMISQKDGIGDRRNGLMERPKGLCFRKKNKLKVHS